MQFHILSFEGPDLYSRAGGLATRLTARGREDPVIGEMDGPVLVWHEDTWELPPGAELLAASDRHPQAFRLGTALGMQPHPEVGPEILAGWLASAPDRHFEESGLSRAALAALLSRRRRSASKSALVW